MDHNLSSKLFYPNPFKPTGIEFTLEENAHVTVKILDGTGGEIERLTDCQDFPAGQHVVPFDHARYRNGEYWYQISVENGDKTFKETKQIT